MKVTPLDLRQTHLSTSLRGFDRDEVRTLLTDAADDYEAALREVDRLRQDLQKAENQLGEHRDREINLRNTLLTAQKVADQIRENAGKEAEVLLRDADVRSQAMLREAELRSASLTSESEARALALVSTAEARTLALTTDAESRATAATREADARADATLREADARADATIRAAEARADAGLRESTARAQATLADAESRAHAMTTDAQLRSESTLNEAQARADALVREAQARVDVLLQKANARLDELEHAVGEMRLRKRDVEGTLEQSIASLTYALEFVRTQESREDKVRMLRPRLAEQGHDTQWSPGRRGRHAGLTPGRSRHAPQHRSPRRPRAGRARGRPDRAGVLALPEVQGCRRRDGVVLVVARRRTRSGNGSPGSRSRTRCRSRPRTSP